MWDRGGAIMRDYHLRKMVSSQLIRSRAFSEDQLIGYAAAGIPGTKRALIQLLSCLCSHVARGSFCSRAGEQMTGPKGAEVLWPSVSLREVPLQISRIP